MAKRLLLTGYGGFVAGSVAWQAGDGWEVHAVSRSQSPTKRDGFQCHRFDLCDTATLGNVFKAVQPHAVIHTAALADIDYCQTHPDEANAVNVGVTRDVAELCRAAGCKLVLCSTDSVFDGLHGRYTEEDRPTPVNVYAETKVKGEEAVLNTVDAAVVARLSLVMGLPVLGAGNSFLAKMIAGLEAGREMPFPENETRTPIDVITLGRALLELADNTLTGFLHLAGSTRLNRYDMAQRIAKRLGFSPTLVTPTNSNALEGRARRPNDASLDNTKAKHALATPMRTLEEGLDLVLKAKEKQEHA